MFTESFETVSFSTKTSTYPEVFNTLNYIYYHPK